MKKRTTGDILLDMEPLLFELVIDQGIQKGELLSLFSVWVDIHYPAAVETYEIDESHPVFQYGHKSLFKGKKK
jgi:hypothetical protein